MYEFTLFNKINYGSIASLLSTSVLTLSISAISIGMAHAEQYCKSIDSSGAVSYTLAPETGCNKKKFKTVSVTRYSAPVSPAANTVVTKTEAPANAVPPAQAENAQSATPTVASSPSPVALEKAQ